MKGTIPVMSLRPYYARLPAAASGVAIPMTMHSTLLPGVYGSTSSADISYLLSIKILLAPGLSVQRGQ